MRSLIVRVAPEPDSPAVGVHVELDDGRVVFLPGSVTRGVCPCGREATDRRAPICGVCAEDCLPDRWGRV